MKAIVACRVKSSIHLFHPSYIMFSPFPVPEVIIPQKECLVKLPSLSTAHMYEALNHRVSESVGCSGEAVLDGWVFVSLVACLRLAKVELFVDLFPQKDLKILPVDNTLHLPDDNTTGLLVDLFVRPAWLGGCNLSGNPGM